MVNSTIWDYVAKPAIPTVSLPPLLTPSPKPSLVRPNRRISKRGPLYRKTAFDNYIY